MGAALLCCLCRTVKTLDRIREHLANVIADGTSTQRKTTIEQLIAEIRITEDHRVIPRLPGAMPSRNGSRKPSLVEPRLRHTNSLITAQGCDLEVPLVGERPPVLPPRGPVRGVAPGAS